MLNSLIQLLLIFVKETSSACLVLQWYTAAPEFPSQTSVVNTLSFMEQMFWNGDGF